MDATCAYSDTSKGSNKGTGAAGVIGCSLNFTVMKVQNSDVGKDGEELSMHTDQSSERLDNSDGIVNCEGRGQCMG